MTDDRADGAPVEGADDAPERAPAAPGSALERLRAIAAERAAAAAKEAVARRQVLPEPPADPPVPAPPAVPAEPVADAPEDPVADGADDVAPEAQDLAPDADAADEHTEPEDTEPEDTEPEDAATVAPVPVPPPLPFAPPLPVPERSPATADDDLDADREAPGTPGGRGPGRAVVLVLALLLAAAAITFGVLYVLARGSVSDHRKLVDKREAVRAAAVQTFTDLTSVDYNDQAGYATRLAADTTGGLHDQITQSAASLFQTIFVPAKEVLKGTPVRAAVSFTAGDDTTARALVLGHVLLTATSLPAGKEEVAGYAFHLKLVDGHWLVDTAASLGGGDTASGTGGAASPAPSAPPTPAPSTAGSGAPSARPGGRASASAKGSPAASKAGGHG